MRVLLLGLQNRKMNMKHSTCDVAFVDYEALGPWVLGWTYVAVEKFLSCPSANSTNAVSDKFISAAIFCLRVSFKSASSKHTAAGFPENGLSVKASTYIRKKHGRAATPDLSTCDALLILTSHTVSLP